MVFGRHVGVGGCMDVGVGLQPPDASTHSTTSLHTLPLPSPPQQTAYRIRQPPAAPEPHGLKGAPILGDDRLEGRVRQLIEAPKVELTHIFEPWQRAEGVGGKLCWRCGVDNEGWRARFRVYCIE